MSLRWYQIDQFWRDGRAPKSHATRSQALFYLGPNIAGFFKAFATLAYAPNLLDR